MNILSKKTKEEIKKLIHTTDYCNMYLAALEPMLLSLNVEREKYKPDKWEYVQLDTANKVEKTRNELYDARERLRELGVY